MTTLKEAINSLSSIMARPKTKGNFSEELFGKYKGLIPKGISSTVWIKKLRDSLYGKVK